MAKQTVTLRMDEDEMTWLSQAEIAGAANFSEKIRALLAEARARREGAQNYAAAYDFTRNLFTRVDRDLNAAEVEAGMRSELVHRVLAWLPEVMAFALSSDLSEDSEKQLHELERGLGERVFALVDSMLQLGRAGFPGCYRPETLENRAAFAVKRNAADGERQNHL